MNHQDQLQELIHEDSGLKEQHVVYRLFYTFHDVPVPDVCIVVSGKTFHRSLTTIKDDLAYYFKNQFKKRSGQNIYEPFYKHVYENQNGNFWIDLVYAGTSPYELLKAAYTYLCGPHNGYIQLNTNELPQIPLATQRKGPRGWINRGHYLNFRIWQKKYDANRKKIA